MRCCLAARSNGARSEGAPRAAAGALELDGGRVFQRLLREGDDVRLYVDKSADPTNPNNENFVLGGIAIFERQTFFLSQQLDSLEVEIFSR
jgi:hypothetical protein